MSRSLFISIFFGVFHFLSAQNYFISGSVKSSKDEYISFGTILLKNASDSSLVKVSISNTDGSFTFLNIPSGKYYIQIDYLGYQKYKSSQISLIDKDITLAPIVLNENNTNLEEVTITASRPIVEVKADKTVFNVQGTINAVGDNGLNLLRKAPGVMVDNNNNLSVLGRSGVLVYLDGRRIPLSGAELSSFLENLNADQIDRIDIITNPGSKYEAQGSAGIIDIRLKKDTSIGANGSLSSTYSQGRYAVGNLSGHANYRSKKFNTFGGLTLNSGKRFHDLFFRSFQNQLYLVESHLSQNTFNSINGRIGVDYYLNKKSTFGILVNGLFHVLDHSSTNKILISKEISPETIDSVLIAPNVSDEIRNQKSINFNYAWTDKTKNLTVDLDYGNFINSNNYLQPNNYYKADLISQLSSNLNEYYTVADIQILSAKMDYEQDLLGGKMGAGTKWTQVTTANEFLFYNIYQNQPILNVWRSNLFDYKESVYAAYLNYKRTFSEKWNISAGLRTELTDASGDLNAFIPELEESPVNFNYIRFFPSGGITYSPIPKHSYSLQFSRRINRPDYNEINPFKEQLSELSYSRGNKFLQPEQVNNLEFGYTFNFKYSVKLAYSLTNDQITKLIGPDPDDPRASYMSIENLATQEIYGLNISLPIDITKWWNAFMNFNFNYINNQADYGSNGRVNVKVFGYNFFQQHTFLLGKKWKGELSGWYSGPGVWGGVFLFDPSYSVNLGVQRKFMNDLLNVRFTVNDIFYQSWWSGMSEFNGQKAFGTGMWDSRRAAISFSFDLGNKNIKSRKRTSGIENESKRAGE